MLHPLQRRIAPAVLALASLVGIGASLAWRDRGPDLRDAVSPWRTTAAGPRPVGDLLGDAAEERNGLERKRWIEELHWSAPEVDWRAVERENGDRERLRRNALAGEAASSEGEWREVGSRNQAGHTRAVALGVTDGGARVYLGSANGGVWRGDLAGRGWTPLSDGLFGGVDGIAHMPGERATLLVRRGPELYWTVDDGRTWHRSTGVEHLRQVRAMVVLEDVQRTVLLLGRWVDEAGAHAGVLASEDGGRTFHGRWTAPGDADGDLWAAPPPAAGAEPLVFLEHKGRLFASRDAGRSFEARGFVDGRATAGELCGANEDDLYAAALVGGQWGLHRSRDGGHTFDRVGGLEDFWRTLGVVPEQPEVVLAGGMECRRSVDGGQTFERVNAWGHYYGDPATRLHADVRSIDVLPDPEGSARSLVFVSTDGGTYLSRDAGETFHNLCLEGLGIGQVYSTLTSTRDQELLLAGTQDQGYQRGRVGGHAGTGPSTEFEQLLSGDYGYLTSSDGTHELVYSSYPGFVLVQEGEETPNLLYPWVDLPTGAQFAWMPPIVADPRDPEVFYLLGDHLYRYARRRGPYWGYRRHSTHDFSAGGARYLTALAFAPGTPSRAYATTDVGRVWISDDGGEAWRASGLEGTDHFRPNALAVAGRDPGRVAVGGSGYGGPAVFSSRDGGATWAPLTEGLPRTLVLDLEFARDGSGDLFAATEAGPWRWSVAVGRWLPLAGADAPATTYWSVEVLDSGWVRFGTYGRGIWDWRPRTPPVEAR